MCSADRAIPAAHTSHCLAYLNPKNTNPSLSDSENILVTPMSYTGTFYPAQSVGHHYSGMMVQVPVVTPTKMLPSNSVRVISASEQWQSSPTSWTPSKRPAAVMDFETSIMGSQTKRTADMWDTIEKWASAQNLQGEQLTEFRHLMKMAMMQHIPKNKLTNPVAIASGSFGKIYRSDYDGTDVAVKEIGESNDGQCNIVTKMRELFLEIRVLVQVRHPNIVGFWGAGLDFPQNGCRHPSMSLVFELCPNGSLHKRIFEDKENAAKLSVASKIQIGKQVAIGLAYLHSKSILHRDLNTRNVLLSGDMTAKIADFGCARFLSQAGTLRTTTILGSPAYMAPEQLMGAELTEAADVWALALLLWEVMTESKPWEGAFTDFNQLRDCICRGDRITVPAASAAEFPARYVSVIRAAMATKPSDRPSAAEVQRELQLARDDPLALASLAAAACGGGGGVHTPSKQAVVVGGGLGPLKRQRE